MIRDVYKRQSLHCPLTKEGESEYPTHYMFNKEVFKRMKKTAILVNCARGGCVNQEDLALSLIHILWGYG